MVIVLVEIADGAPVGVGLELINGAKAIAKGEKVTALVLGEGVEAAAKTAIEYGADDAIIVDGAQYADYNSDVYACAVAKVIDEAKPAVVLMGATALGKDLVPRVAAKVGAGCVCDATGLAVNEAGEVVYTVPAFSGNILTDVVLSTPIQIASVRGGSIPKAEPEAGKAGDIAKKDIAVAAEDIKIQVKEAIKEISESVNLEEAEVIVAGGRGMGNADNFNQLQELADVFGGVVGCTRPAMEAGWVTRAHQVGQSGKIVAPKLYIAFGISGATQHVSGMIGSKYIVAINKDEDAPIFEVADVGIVGNCMDVLPVMLEEIKKRKA